MSDIDTAVADSLKVLDLKRPIREADIEPIATEAGYGRDLRSRSHLDLFPSLSSSERT